MQTPDNMKHLETLGALNRLLKNGATHIAIIMRHSHRFFDMDNTREPFMGLTPEGQAMAYDAGTRLPPDITPCFYSSVFGRCIETAFLMDKGFFNTHGRPTPHNRSLEILSPFYVQDLTLAVDMMQEMGSDHFLRAWFNGDIHKSIMMPARQAAEKMIHFLHETAGALSSEQVCLCVSHDWNLYPIKEFMLGLTPEASGPVGYLEGILVYFKGGDWHLEAVSPDPVTRTLDAHQTAP